MRIVATHAGSHRPFERDRRLVLRAIPEGATIHAATATLAPIGRGGDLQFPETIAFTDGDGDWGAAQRVGDDFAELDLHARRRLAAISGSGVDGATLLVDQGGGWMAVDENGRPGGDSPTQLSGDPATLPGLLVTGLRLIEDSTAIAVEHLDIASPPSNVTMAIEGSPTFFTHVGDLVDPVTTPDFADLLQEALATATVVDGRHEVGFVVHSDSIARLDVTLDLDVAVAAPLVEAGVDRVSLPFSFGTLADVDGSPLTVAVARGQRAVRGATTGRVRGSIEASRIVAGATGRASVTGRTEVGPGQPQAQPLVLDTSTLATSLDLYVAAITSSVDLVVDVVGDLDGKPGHTSLLSAMATTTVTRDDAPDLTWVNVALPGEVELPAGVRHWIVLQARDGRASWAHASATTGPDLQTSPDDGLSWRAAGGDGPVAAHLRLRHSGPTFRMPLELRVAAGGEEVAVDLQRFSHTGRMDFSLDLPELSDAINTALDGNDAATPPAGEHVANGSFSGWIRAGDGVGTPSGPLDLDGRAPTVTAFAPDGATLWVLTTGETALSVTGVDAYCRLPLTQFEFADRDMPTGLLVHPAGRQALVLLARPVFEVNVIAHASTVPTARTMVLVDLVAGRPIGAPIDLFDPIVAMAGDPTGAVVNLLLGDREGGSGPGITRVGWDELAGMAGAATPADDAVTRPVGHHPVAIDVAADGSVLTVGVADDRTVVEVHPPDLRAAPAVARFPASSPPRAAAFADHDQRIVVVEDDTVAITRPGSSRPPTRLDLPGNPDGGHRLVGTDPVTGAAWVGADTSLARLDASRRRFDAPVDLDRIGFLAVSPVGNRVAVTTVSTDTTVAVTSARLITVGSDLPDGWEVTAGTIQPGCFGDPPRRTAVLGGDDDTGAGPSAVSQVVAVTPGTPHRLAVDAVAAVDDASAEVLWRNAAGGADRVDVVSIASTSPGSPTVLAPIHHDRVLRSPSTAVAAEIRLVAPEAWMVVGRVSLTGASDVATNPGMEVGGAGSVGGWTPSAASLTAEVGADGMTVLRNNGTAPGSWSQQVTVDGSTWQLQVAARMQPPTTASIGVVEDDEGSVAVVFVDDAGAVQDPVATVPITPLGFDRAAASGSVPSGAVAATLAIVMPSGAAVEVDEVVFVVDDPVEVTIDVVSEAPGEVLVSDPTVGLDTLGPRDPPAAPGDLPAPTPPGSEPRAEGGSAHCCACGRRTAVEPSRTPATGTAAVSPCGSCGQPRVVVAGASSVSAAAGVAGVAGVSPASVAASADVAVPTFSTGSVALPTDTAVLAGLVVDAPLTDVVGIGPVRAASLAAMGVDSLHALAGADPVRVATVPGVSTRMARRFIHDAHGMVAGGRWGLVAVGRT